MLIRAIVGEVLEYACFLSLRNKDVASFERYFAQLKPYYYDYATLLPASAQQHTIVGLNLLRLLSRNNLAEFHTELGKPFWIAWICLCVCCVFDEGFYNRYCTDLRKVPPLQYTNNIIIIELIPAEAQQNMYIKHPIQLEQYMMEGAYNKVPPPENKKPVER